MRRQALTAPSATAAGQGHPRLPALALSLVLVLVLIGLLAAPLAVAAAEVQQVRQATLLQVGDSNRSYAVRLACISVEPEQEAEATAWLRRRAPRGTRVNLRPLGEREGTLLARVSTLPRGRGGGEDLSVALLSSGLARPGVDTLSDASCSGLS